MNGQHRTEHKKKAEGDNNPIEALRKEFEENYAKQIKELGTIPIERLVDIAKTVGKRLGNPRDENSRGINLKMNQIRKFLDALRRLEIHVNELKRNEDSGMPASDWNEIRYQLTLLRPKLAYAAGRKEEVKPLMAVLEPAIKAAAESPRELFDRLLRFVEAIVAYHRYYGGNN
jgi:CRISPR-associated protein Csm2